MLSGSPLAARAVQTRFPILALGDGEWDEARKAAGLQKQEPFHEKAIQVKADVAAFLKIIARVWLHDSTPTHGRRQPAAVRK